MRRSRKPVAAGAVAATVLAAFAAGAPSPARATTVSELHASGSDVALPHGPLLLRAAPDSDRIVARVERRTMFGSRTKLAVVAQTDGWLEVISDELVNDVHGFVRSARVQLTHDPYSVEVDRTARRLTVWRLGVRMHRIGVAIGARSTPTPLGRFAITDKLRNFWSAYYGCCVLALSGRQPRPTPTWFGDTRLAIHAGGGIGSAVSNGCLRATTTSMRYLMRVIPVGTQVIVHD